MTLVGAYASAIISSVSFGVASVAEQKATREIGSLSGLSLKTLFTLGKRPYYIAGLMLDVVGYGAFILAVRALPLFFVQAVGTASILVAAVTARLFLKARLSKQAYVYILVILFGLLLLSFATGHAETPVPAILTQRLLLLFASIVAVSGVAVRKVASKHPAYAATVSGLCFSVIAVLTRILQIPHHWWLLAVSPTVILIAVNGLLGIMLFSAALQTGLAAIVYSISFVVDTIVPTVLGVGLLGDRPLNHHWDFLGLGLLTILTGVILLATQNQKMTE